ncbi:MAG: ATP-dependent DNA helicase [Gammaproteobacteria bacterium]|nr:ATP-dependent DNA helicase [Gammaproteobacteria bacterium]
MNDWVQEFSADSPLAMAVEGFAPRAEQQVMAERVGRALASGRSLVIEAGTGIGKTFAYLVPALMSGRRVIISTGTRNLQDQLFERDLPTVCAALGRPVAVALLKGRANYLCLHRLALADAGELRLAGRELVAELARVREWAGSTLSGDIAEVSGVDESSRLWPQVTSTVENCLGTRCDDYQRCHVVRARRQAQEAQIVVVNHHLLLADLALKEDGFGELLPGADAVIVDEAHQLPDTAVQFFGIAVSSRGLTGLVRDLRLEARRAPGSAGALEQACDRLLLATRELRLALGPTAERRDWQTLGPKCHAALDTLAGICGELAADLNRLEGAQAGLDRCAERTRELSVRLERLLGAETEEGLRWVDISRYGFTLHLTPYDVSDRLQEVMRARDCAWIFTSATLAVGEDFGHFTARLGLAEVDSCVLASPFDYARQGLLYLPGDLPPPASPNYTRALIEAALPLLEAAQGRAFLLFTSHRALDEARACLSSLDLGYTLLVQGSAPKRELLQAFRVAERPVLLGTSSFWEGVDVRGEALKLVVIDRLPFASPGDPLLRARIEAARRHGQDAFRSVQLPQAVIALKQGVGRLIRDPADRGVVMLCDPRITGRGYGRVFLHALPPFRQSRRLADACELLSDNAIEGPGEAVHAR